MRFQVKFCAAEDTVEFCAAEDTVEFCAAEDTVDCSTKNARTLNSAHNI